jgi:hypothetical protein
MTAYLILTDFPNFNIKYRVDYKLCLVINNNKSIYNEAGMWNR